jgi:hypothetical protein
MENGKWRMHVMPILHFQFSIFHYCKMVGFHDQVCEQSLASFVHFGGGFVFAGRLDVHADMFADANVRYPFNMEIAHAVVNGLALWVEEFFVGHDVYFCDVFHNCWYQELAFGIVND